MARAYKMTPARRAAIRKAQAASARKRKGRRAASRPTQKQIRNKKVIKGVAIGAAAVGFGVAAVYGGKEYQKSDRHYVNHSVRKSTRKLHEKSIVATGKRANKQAVAVNAKRVRPLASANARKRTVKRAPGKPVKKK